MPEWDADRLYALFCKRRALQLSDADHARLQELRSRVNSKTKRPLDETEEQELAALDQRDRAAELPADADDEYTRLLMWLIDQRFAHHEFTRSLRRRRLDPEDAAATVLTAVRRRTRRLTLKHASHRVLLSNLHSAIYCSALDFMRRSRLGDFVDGDVYGAEGMDALPAGSAMLADADDILARLLARQDELTGDVVGEPSRVSACFRLIARALVLQEPIPLWEELPGKERPTAEAYDLLRVRAVLGLEGRDPAKYPGWLDRLSPRARMRWKAFLDLFGDAALPGMRRAALALGGTTTTWPDVDDLAPVETHVRDEWIVDRLKRDPSPASAQALVVQTGLDRRAIARIFGTTVGHGLAAERGRQA